MSTIPSTAAIPVVSSVAVTPDAEPTRKRWTRAEYYRLGEQGWFDDQRVELIDGEIIVLSPQSPGHSYATTVITDLLREVFGKGYWTRCHGPITRGEYSEPEPDVSVVRGVGRDFLSGHPDSAVLLVEVSRTSVRHDLSTKAGLYASIGVPDYWVLDLNERVLHVHRGPVPDEGSPFGYRYQRIEKIDAVGHVAPLEKPDAKIAVADMLPG